MSCQKSQIVDSSHILIRSADRDNYENSTPAKFRVNLSKPQKATKAQISFAQIPSTFYNITSKNNAFEGDSIFTIDPGNYSLSDLLVALKNKLDATYADTFTVSFDVITGLVTISAVLAFDINFNVPNSIAKKIGFLEANYTGSNSYTGVFVPKIYDNVIFISTNFGSVIQTTTNKKNVSFAIPHNVNRGDIIQFYSQTQFSLQPRVRDQTIGYIEFEVYDEDGNLCQGLADWCIMIELI